MSFRHVNWSATCAVLIFCMDMALPCRATADDMVAKIIENVRRNEALYEDIDVTLRYASDIGDRKPNEMFMGGSSKPNLFEARTTQYTLHYVAQNGLFRLERNGGAQLASGPVSYDRIRAFDGSTTRLFDQKAYGNVIRGRSVDESFVRPHMFLMRCMKYTFPLSAYLSGNDAINAWPSSNFPAASTVHSSYHGEGEYHGLHCHIVWSTAVNAGEPTSRWEFWLAEDRNYIPVRVLGYTFQWSKSIPLGEGMVVAFQEIKPGVWFPTESKKTSYKTTVLQNTGKQELQWREQYITEKVSLNPTYDVSYFRDVKFPDGIPVYEVSDGKIQSGHVKGAPAPHSRPRGARTIGRWWLLWTNLAAAGALIAAVYVFVRRRRSGV